MAAAVKLEYTVEEYLAMERASETKHEYVNGQITAMAGATKWHDQISFNLHGIFYTLFRNRNCTGYTNDTRVNINAVGAYTYPDLSLVCGEPKFDQGNANTLLNPTVIIEVLSTSTEGYDRGEKFQQYRALESLRQYVLVSHRVASPD